MSVGDWIQAIAAVATLAAVVAAIIGNRVAVAANRTAIAGNETSMRAVENARSEWHAATVLQTATEVLAAAASVQANFLPYWKDEANREKYADVAQEVRVHQDMERLRTFARVAEASISMGGERGASAQRYVRATKVLVGAMFLQYYVVIPGRGDPRFIATVSQANKAFQDELKKSNVPMPTGEAYEPNAKQDAAQYASGVVDAAMAEFTSSLEAYVRAIRGLPSAQDANLGKPLVGEQTRALGQDDATERPMGI